MSDSYELLDSLPQTGRVTWIGLSPATGQPLVPVEHVLAEVGTGLAGDHHSTHRPGGNRQVTLIQSEHLDVVAKLLELDQVSPFQTRRNIVVSGINLQALKKRRFQIGTALLEGTGDCVPCSQMERNLGAGGFNAMRGHGGITAIVIEPGEIQLNSPVKLVCE